MALKEDKYWWVEAKKREKTFNFKNALTHKKVWQKTDEFYMLLALKQALKAYKINEVPVGCVIVKDDKIISRGYNQRETKKNPLAHAEIIAINKAAKKLKSWRLEKTKLYVTKEPCPMCAGAIVQARIPEVIYGCDDTKAGAAGTVLNILNNSNLNHRVKIIKGVLEKEGKNLLQRFFKRLRKRSIEQ